MTHGLGRQAYRGPSIGQQVATWYTLSYFNLKVHSR